MTGHMKELITIILNQLIKQINTSKEIWDFVQSSPHYQDKTTMIITTDHGRGLKRKWRHHGSKFKHSDQVWFAIIGPDM